MDKFKEESEKLCQLVEKSKGSQLIDVPLEKKKPSLFERFIHWLIGSM